MSYDEEQYQSMRSAGVPHKIALSLAKVGAPTGTSSGNIEPLPANANQQQLNQKLNEIIDHLNGDGDG